jgi:hypothetical protein
MGVEYGKYALQGAKHRIKELRIKKIPEFLKH